MYPKSLFSILLFTGVVLGCAVDRTPQFAPIPASAGAANLGPDGYAVEQFGGGAYMVTEGSYQGQYWCCSKG
jgi:hypothetical protein